MGACCCAGMNITIQVQRAEHIYETHTSANNLDRRPLGEHGYTETIKFLPSIPGRPVPDAEHVVQQLLLLLVVIATTMATLETYRAHTPERQAAAAARRVLQPAPTDIAGHAEINME